MSFQAYPRYKDSNIEWLGAIPTDWQVKKFRHTFRESDEKIESEVVGPMLSVSGYRGIEVKEYDDENRRRSDEDLIGYRIVRPGQLVVNTMWLNYAGLGVSEHEGHVSPAYRAYQFFDEKADRRFIHHLMRSSAYVLAYTQLLTGIRPNSLQMSRADLMDFPIVLPPQPTQRAIAAFLDRETAKIDTLIGEQRRLIALLKEKRQAVISHGVTKGLKPDAPMKDSGIEWLGKVPAHWEVSRLKFHITLLTSGSRGWGDFYADEGPIFVRIGNMARDTIQLDLADLQRVAVPEDAEGARTKLQANDLLFSITAYLGSVAVVPEGLGEAYVSQHVALCRLNEAAPDAKWLGYLALSEVGKTHFDLRAYGSTKIQLSLSDVSALPVLVPPAAEQDEILARLENELGKLIALEAEVDGAIVLLSERRAALISAAVTGKIDVRGSAKVLLLPVDRARARGLVATEIMERCANQPTFGRVKFQKIAFLAEAHVGISELAGSYMREAAGPLDRALIDEMERGARSIAGIEHEQPGGSGTTVSYRLGEQRGAHRQELADWLGANRTAKLNTLISDCERLTTKQAEAVATLYCVWNDALSAGASPTDDEIISGFLNDWHPEKRNKFRASDLPEWLGWMRCHGIVPTGSGPNTSTGRLFV